MTRVRGTTYADVFGWRNADYLNGLKEGVCFFHHRIPTSTGNTLESAHPFFNEEKNMMLVHNGMISNDTEIHHRLVKKGHIFESEIILDEFNDSEVILHLLEDKLVENNNDMVKSLEQVGDELKGSFVIVVALKEEEEVYFLRHNNPLVISKDKEDNFFFSSEHHNANINDYYGAKLETGLKQLYELAEGEIGVLRPDGYEKLNIMKFYTPPPVIQDFSEEEEGDFVWTDENGVTHKIINEQKKSPYATPMRSDVFDIKGTLRTRIFGLLNSYAWEDNKVDFIDVCDNIQQNLKSEGITLSGVSQYNKFIKYIKNYFYYRVEDDYLINNVLPGYDWLIGDTSGY